MKVVFNLCYPSRIKLKLFSTLYLNVARSLFFLSCAFLSSLAVVMAVASLTLGLPLSPSQLSLDKTPAHQLQRSVHIIAEAGQLILHRCSAQQALSASSANSHRLWMA